MEMTMAPFTFGVHKRSKIAYGELRWGNSRCSAWSIDVVLSLWPQCQIFWSMLHLRSCLPHSYLPQGVVCQMDGKAPHGPPLVFLLLKCPCRTHLPLLANYKSLNVPAGDGKALATSPHCDACWLKTISCLLFSLENIPSFLTPSCTIWNKSDHSFVSLDTSSWLNRLC